MKQTIFTIWTLFLIATATAQPNGFKWIRTLPYQSVNAYHEDLAAFYEQGLWGYIGPDGEVKISPQYEEAGDFNQGVAIVQRNGKWGVIKSDNTVLFDYIYSRISAFDSGLALAEKEGKTFYITTSGEERKLNSKFNYFPYKEGFARICKNGKWGYINTKGVCVIDPNYTTATDFSGNMALVSKGSESYYHINTKGKKKKLAVGDTLTLHFHDQLARVKRSGNYGYVNTNGDKAIDYQFDEARDFSEGMAPVRYTLERYRGYINTSGDHLFDAPFDESGDFSEGIARIRIKNRYGYINKKGSLIIDTLFTSASDFHNGRAIVSVGNRKGVIQIREKNEPVAEIAELQVMLADENQNGRIEAGEKFRFICKVRNQGNDTMRNLQLSLQGRPDQMLYFDLDTNVYHCASLKPYSDTTIAFPGTARLTLLSDRVYLNFRAEAENTFLLREISLQLLTMGINECKPLFSGYWFYKDDHSLLKTGDRVNLKLDITNDGRDIAKMVKVSLLLPPGISSDTTSFHIDLLGPYENRTLETCIRIDSAISAGQFNIVASLSEYSNKKKDIKYLIFDTDKINPEISFLERSYTTGNNLALSSAQETESELLNGLNIHNELVNEKYALIIGNEDYDSYKKANTYEPNVDFAKRDAEVFAAYARKVMGVPDDHIILIKNATFAQMNFNLNKITEISRQNPGKNELIVYYAGHGQHDPDTRETYLVPVDVSLTTPRMGIKLEDVYSNLSLCGAEKTLFFLDACYSGVGRGIVIKPKNIPLKGNILVFTATSSDQRSMPYKEKRHGLFTYFLLDALKNNKGDISIEQLYQDVSKKVEQKSIWLNNSKQSPELLKGEGIQTNWNEWGIK